MLSVIIPANNEEGCIGPCLTALLSSRWPDEERVEVVVAANACRDGTVAEAEHFAARAEARGWTLAVLDIAQPGKLNALNFADARAKGGARVYLDADVIVEADVLAQLHVALRDDAPRYATATVEISEPCSWATRAYRRIYRKVPYNTTTVAGYGLFAVNAAGRARWDAFPDIIADDQFVRLHFTGEERVRVPAHYHWSLVEGYGTLVKVRRRQDMGNAEIARRWPELAAREDKAPTSAGWMTRTALSDPLGFLVYASVIGAARLGRGTAGGNWARGR